MLGGRFQPDALHRPRTRQRNRQRQLQGAVLRQRHGDVLDSPSFGNAVAVLTNPQTWNQYAYAINNPLMFIDPTGTDFCVGGGWFDGYNDEASCEDNGGYWIGFGIGNDNTVPIEVLALSNPPTGEGRLRRKHYFPPRMLTLNAGSLLQSLGNPTPNSRNIIAYANPQQQKQAPPDSSCGVRALQSFALHGVADGLGAVPVYGPVLSAVAGYGVAAMDFASAESIGTANLAVGTAYAVAYGNRGAIAKISADVAEAVPGAGVVLSGGQVVLDGIHAYSNFRACRGGGG